MAPLILLPHSDPFPDSIPQIRPSLAGCWVTQPEGIWKSSEAIASCAWVKLFQHPPR